MDNDNKVKAYFKEFEGKQLSWPTFLQIILAKDAVDLKQYASVFESLKPAKEEEKFFGAILKRSLSHPIYKRRTDAEKLEMSLKILNGLRDLGLLEAHNLVSLEQTYLQNLVSLLEKRLSLRPGEADMLVMQHRFVVQRKDNSKYNIKRTLLQIGEKNGRSAMSTLVGTPTAIATQVMHSVESISLNLFICSPSLPVSNI